MATTFQDLVSEVTGIVPGYSVFLAARDVKKAYRDILDRRTWSFLVKFGAFNAPAMISVGTFHVVQNATTVHADTLAAAAIDAVVTADERPALNQRQWRTGDVGSIYNIVAWDTVGKILTLDRPLVETTDVASPYQLYQCYYPPPPEALLPSGEYDFNRWISVLDPVNGYVLKQDKSKAWLDLRDPQRQDIDLAYYLFDYAYHGTTPTYEFWPHPQGPQTFLAYYKAYGMDFTEGLSPLPRMIPDSLVIDRALYKYAYRWAQVNAGRDPKLKNGNWSFLQQEGDRQWKVDLQAAKLEDENVYMQAIVGPMRNRGFIGPIDARFMQSHDMGFGILH